MQRQRREIREIRLETRSRTETGRYTRPRDEQQRQGRTSEREMDAPPWAVRECAWSTRCSRLHARQHTRMRDNTEQRRFTGQRRMDSQQQALGWSAMAHRRQACGGAAARRARDPCSRGLQAKQHTMSKDAGAVWPGSQAGDRQRKIGVLTGLASAALVALRAHAHALKRVRADHAVMKSAGMEERNEPRRAPEDTHCRSCAGPSDPQSLRTPRTPTDNAAISTDRDKEESFSQQD